MALDAIAEEIGTTTDEQTDDSGNRFADESMADDQHRRDMAGYDGGFTVDH